MKEFHEALNWASREKLPIIFHIQDNEYVISVHISEETSEARYLIWFQDIKLSKYDVDGTDFLKLTLFSSS